MPKKQPRRTTKKTPKPPTKATSKKPYPKKYTKASQPKPTSDPKVGFVPIDPEAKEPCWAYRPAKRKYRPPQEGQDPTTGKFTPGNKLGRGFAGGKAGKLRLALMQSLTEEEMFYIGLGLRNAALTGDLRAVAELLDRTIGKPAQTDLIERVEHLEQLLEQLTGEGPTDDANDQDKGST